LPPYFQVDSDPPDGRFTESVRTFGTASGQNRELCHLCQVWKPPRVHRRQRRHHCAERRDLPVDAPKQDQTPVPRQTTGGLLKNRDCISPPCCANAGRKVFRPAIWARGRALTKSQARLAHVAPVVQTHHTMQTEMTSPRPRRGDLGRHLMRHTSLHEYILCHTLVLDKKTAPLRCRPDKLTFPSAH
jgi:hypothetical protein